jgi:predicted nucleic acid-binding protein
VAEPPVINASPLIFLSRGGLLDLLQLLSDEVLVPSAVALEIQQRGAEDPSVIALQQTKWLTVVEAPPTPEIIQSWDLGKGESSVLTWAHIHTDTEAIVDDLAARRCAAVLGIPVRGTLGLILTAKQRGRISAARPILENLRSLGMYLSDRVINQALKMVDE